MGAFRSALMGKNVSKCQSAATCCLFSSSHCQTVSQYTVPHRFTAAAEAYSDNVDLSVDKFPLIDDKEESPESSWPSKEEVALPAKTLQKEMMDSSSRALKTRYRFILGHLINLACSEEEWNMVSSNTLVSHHHIQLPLWTCSLSCN